jgi:hypothetical protein
MRLVTMVIDGANPQAEIISLLAGGPTRTVHLYRRR